MDRFYNKFSTEFTNLLRGFKPSITASGKLCFCCYFFFVFSLSSCCFCFKQTDLHLTGFITWSLLSWAGYVHSRVEEEFLWDCKQLGAYSPIVLLNTLLFFCCKYFGFTTVEQHRQLSFAHVMRCTKTNSDNTKTTFLRFYPPLSINEAESGTSRVEGQGEVLINVILAIVYISEHKKTTNNSLESVLYYNSLNCNAFIRCF